MNAFEVGSNFMQKHAKLMALVYAQALNGNVGKPSHLSLQKSMNTATLTGRMERDTPAVPGIGLRLKQFLILQASDQAGELSLILP
jgi:hypothetical protein